MGGDFLSKAPSMNFRTSREVASIRPSEATAAVSPAAEPVAGDGSASGKLALGGYWTGRILKKSSKPRM